MSVEDVGDRLVASSHTLHVAGSPESRDRLDGLVRRLTAALAGRGIRCEPALLNRGDDGYMAFVKRLQTGVDRLVAASPVLARDLFPHVQAIAIVDVAAVGSASERDYPGLLVLPASASEVEIVEGLVHEGAHQKLFDISLTCDLAFEGPGHGAVRVSPSWLPDGVTWPLAQVFAALHAYCCLAALESEVGPEWSWPASSLVPVALTRATELARSLIDHEAALTSEGRRFLEALTTGTAGVSAETGDGHIDPIGIDLVVTRQFADRCLVVLRRASAGGRAVEVYWARGVSDSEIRRDLTKA